MIDKIALTLLIIGGINWGCVGIFSLTLWHGYAVVKRVLSAVLFTFSLRLPQFGVYRFYSEIPTPILRLQMIPCNAKVAVRYEQPPYYMCI